MELDFRAFAFITTLAAVINGLGVVRWVTGFAEYLKRRSALKVEHYWVFSLWAGAQFLFHILLWWSLWGVREVESFNLITYLYLLAGPVLLYLGTSLLAPSLEGELIDFSAHYFEVRRSYFTVSTMLWCWMIFAWPVLLGLFSPTTPVLVICFLTAFTLRSTADKRIHAALAVMIWLVLITFVSVFGMQLGGVAQSMI